MKISKNYYRQVTTFTVFVIYFILNLIVSIISGSYIFFLSAIISSLIILLITYNIEYNYRREYLLIIGSFLLIYSFFVIITHALFIDNPFGSYFLNSDENGFFSRSSELTSLNYYDIWRAAFNEFQYSESPLFHAWIATLQKLAIVTSCNDYYSLLFLKLNTAFIGSVIPGVIYLIALKYCNKITAFKAAITYGLLGYIFINSLGLMRDVHIALIYVIGINNILNEKRDLSNLITLMVLGIGAYFIRLENGLFFLAFISIWIFQSGLKRKKLVVSISVLIFTFVLISLGGFEYIYSRFIRTSVEGYGQRAFEVAEEGSLAINLRLLPFPFNYLSITAFGQINQFPFWKVFRNDVSWYKNLFYLIEVAATFFWFLVWVRILSNWEKTLVFVKENKLLIGITFIFLISVSIGEISIRRLMPIYPIIFVAYVFLNDKIFTVKDIMSSIYIYTCLILLYTLLKY